jgi:hypothetical protein
MNEHTMNQSSSEFDEVGLASKAMLISLTISNPSGTKKDKDASVETAASHQADKDAVSVNKRLWSKEAMQLFAQPANAARKIFAENSQPWSKGSRILLAVGFEKFEKEMQQQEKLFWEGVESFIAHVQEHLEEARQAAGTLFDEEDYNLERADLQEKFGFELQFLPVPTQGDFRVNLSGVEQERIKEQLSDNMQRSYATAVKSSWERLYTATSTLADRLKAFENGETRVVRSAIVDNVQNLCDILPSLNLAGDPELTRLGEEISDRLTGSTAKELKNDNTLRKTTRLAADELARKVDAYLDLL